MNFRVIYDTESLKPNDSHLNWLQLSHEVCTYGDLQNVFLSWNVRYCVTWPVCNFAVLSFKASVPSWRMDNSIMHVNISSRHWCTRSGFHHYTSHYPDFPPLFSLLLTVSVHTAPPAVETTEQLHPAVIFSRSLNRGKYYSLTGWHHCSSFKGSQAAGWGCTCLSLWPLFT